MSDLKDSSNHISLFPAQISSRSESEIFFAHPKPWSFILCLLLRALFIYFFVSFTFISLIQLELIFEYGVKQASSFMFSHDSSIDQALFNDKSTPSPWPVALLLP